MMMLLVIILVITIRMERNVIMRQNRMCMYVDCGLMPIGEIGVATALPHAC